MPVLDWIGKDKVVNYYKNLPISTLIKDKDFSNEDKISNLFIEGDNLFALKALLPKYKGKIKCIYIDPPYNTGKEGWKYNDNVNDPRIKEWIKKTVGKESEDLSRHDKWLCMMYPRLLLAEEFLTEDGIMFVSIDDNSIQYLKILMDEIFKRGNLLANFVWQSDGNADNQGKVKVVHEYILAYCKNIDLFPHPNVIDPSVLKNKKSKLHNSEIRNTIVKNGPKNPISEIELPAGFPCDIEKLFIPKRTDAWPNYDRDVVVEDYKLVYPVKASSGWASKNIFLKFIENDFNPVLDTKKQETIFTITNSGNIEGVKGRKKETQSHVLSVLRDLGSTQSMSSRLAEQNMEFDFPKPTELLEYLISMVSGKDFYVLDFFSGSGSTAEAVVQLNLRDEGNRKFILVEWDESSLKDIGLHRIKNKIEDNVLLSDLGYSYFKISEPIVDKFKNIRKNLSLDTFLDYLYYKEFNEARDSEVFKNLKVGQYNDKTLYLLHPDNEIFNENLLESLSEKNLFKFNEGLSIIYGSHSSISSKKLADLNIVFKQIPYDL